MIFIYLRIWNLSSHSRNFHSYGDITIDGEGLLQILTYTRRSWPFSSEGSLACHPYCDTGLTFIIGHLRGPVTLTPNAKRLAVELSLPVLTTWVCPDMSGMYMSATAAVEWWKWLFCSYLPFADNSPLNSSRSNYHYRMFFFSQICLELQMNQEL